MRFPQFEHGEKMNVQQGTWSCDQWLISGAYAPFHWGRLILEQVGSAPIRHVSTMFVWAKPTPFFDDLCLGPNLAEATQHIHSYLVVVDTDWPSISSKRQGDVCKHIDSGVFISPWGLRAFPSVCTGIRCSRGRRFPSTEQPGKKSKQWWRGLKQAFLKTNTRNDKEFC